MGLIDIILKAVDADYQPLSTFTSEPGAFRAGERVRDDDTFSGRPRFFKIIGTDTRYRRDGDHYDRVYTKRVESLQGCTCGRPGCPG